MEPVTITKNGWDRLMVVSAEEYRRLARRDRCVIRPEDLTAHTTFGLPQRKRTTSPAQVAQRRNTLQSAAIGGIFCI